MARSSSVGASPDWLLRATAKLEKSIFRRVEHKYKKKFSDLYDIIRRLEDEANSTDNDLFDSKARIVELENLLALYTNPTVTLKNLEKEVYRVKPTIEKFANEEGKKRKFEEPTKEISEIIFFRDSPASKILKVGPAPRPAIPLPLPSIKTTKPNPEKKRARSISPTPKFSFKNFTNEKKNFTSRNQSHSPQPQPPPTPLLNRRPAGNWKKRKKDKEEKEKEKGNL